MKRIFHLLISLAILLIVISCNNNSTSVASIDSTNITAVTKDSNEQQFDSIDLKADTNFAINAADGGMSEVQLGKLAQANASLPLVKKLGEMMVDDHTRVNNELKVLVQKEHIIIPGMLSDESQKVYDGLSKKKGKDFDIAYTELMVNGHEKVLSAFQKEAHEGNNAGLKAWANEHLSLLEGHLQMSREAMDKVKEQE